MKIVKSSARRVAELVGSLLEKNRYGAKKTGRSEDTFCRLNVSKSTSPLTIFNELTNTCLPRVCQFVFALRCRPFCDIHIFFK